MIRTLALSAALAASTSFATPSFAETYDNPDRAWWTRFLETLNGSTPDLEAEARQDPRYLGSDEFTRTEVLAEIIAEMEAARQEIDPATTVVTLPMRASLGDYDATSGGFPVSTFRSGSYLQVGVGSSLYFANADDVRIYPAALDDAKALRARIGTQDIIARLTLIDIRPSTSRRNAYEAHVARVDYETTGGVPLLTVEADPAATGGADDAAGAEAVEAGIIAAAGLPPLGSSWEAAMEQFRGSDYFYVVSNAQYDLPGGSAPVYVRKDGAITTLMEPRPTDAFTVYLQPVEGDWGIDRGRSFSVIGLTGQDGLDTTGLGPGLNCGTPGVLDRCAMLRFEPSDTGHVLTSAWGVLEMPGDLTAEGVLSRFGGPSAFDTSDTVLAYDTRDIAAGDRTVHRGSSLGVRATLATAGAARDEPPRYDPLEMTSGARDRIRRAVEVYAVEGAEGRTPVLYTLSR
ncbi:hypothetical protein [Falsirhodobacter halotolerans]|uniref:hypothetical protein n=1 Tax=Falsirhodobacter halotolerans TaxID=1146892 RepID=UPI001FD5068C|nr:hypothetical protein [Falsirhodobacter halotolerans]MCJ8140135.1 hypothetical protein [Falsirhodobacter halotolerans]